MFGEWVRSSKLDKRSGSQQLIGEWIDANSLRHLGGEDVHDHERAAAMFFSCLTVGLVSSVDGSIKKKGPQWAGGGHGHFRRFPDIRFEQATVNRTTGGWTVFGLKNLLNA